MPSQHGVNTSGSEPGDDYCLPLRTHRQCSKRPRLCGRGLSKGALRKRRCLAGPPIDSRLAAKRESRPAPSGLATLAQRNERSSPTGTDRELCVIGKAGAARVVTIDSLLTNSEIPPAAARVARPSSDQNAFEKAKRASASALPSSESSGQQFSIRLTRASRTRRMACRVREGAVASAAGRDRRARSRVACASSRLVDVEHNAVGRPQTRRLPEKQLRGKRRAATPSWECSPQLEQLRRSPP
jgi:hypothetical protein